MIPGSGRCPGEGNAYPLQYSCLKNPIDRGAWRAPQRIRNGITPSGVKLSASGWAASPVGEGAVWRAAGLQVQGRLPRASGWLKGWVEAELEELQEGLLSASSKGVLLFPAPRPLQRGSQGARKPRWLLDRWAVRFQGHSEMQDRGGGSQAVGTDCPS